MVLDRKTSQEYWANGGVPQGPSLGATLFLLYINYIPDDVICNIAIYVDETIVHCKYDQAFDLWQQLLLTSELESDHLDTELWSSKWLADFSTGKTWFILFEQSNNTGAIDVKMDGAVLKEKLYWSSCIVSITKFAPKEIGSLFYDISFSWGCSVSLWIYHTTLHGILLSCLGAATWKL